MQEQAAGLHPLNTTSKRQRPLFRRLFYPIFTTSTEKIILPSLLCCCMMNRLLWFLFCFVFARAGAQNTIALPEIIDYTKQAYNAGTQNWKICQDGRGIVYFANPEGLLSFDGHFWKKYCVPGVGGIRSLALAKNGRIYTGAEGEIGYFEPGQNGQLQYHSLNRLIPAAEKDFTDVWDVVPVGNEVFFRSFKRILHLKAETITTYPDIAWSFMGEWKGQLIAKAYNKGLLALNDGHWLPLASNPLLPEKAQVVSVLPLAADSALIVTRKHGFYSLRQNRLSVYSSPALEAVAEKNPYAAILLHNDEIAVATNLGGCFILNKGGGLVQRIAKQDGLQSNNVLTAFQDRTGNLWLGLDKGINFIGFSSAIKHLYPDYEEHSGGKTAIVYHDKLYIGTSNGLYRAPLQQAKDLGRARSDFSLVPGTKGQVWGLSEVNGDLLMAHNDGFFRVRNETAELIDSSTGFWNFYPLSAILPSSKILAGTYNGVNVYNYADGKIVNPPVHRHIESARFVVVDNDVAWACHSSKGLYKIQLNGGVNPSFAAYPDKKGLLSPTNNRIFKIKNRIVLTNDKGIFEYSSQTGDFEPSEYIRNIVKTPVVQYLKEDDNGKVWFVKDKRLGVVDFSAGHPNIVYFPELNNKLLSNGFENVYPYDENNVFVPGDEGYFLINYEAYKKRAEPTSVLISGVRIINKIDSTVFGGYYANAADDKTSINGQVPEIGYSWNSLHFDFASSSYGRQEVVEFAYYLEDFDKGWSAWARKNEKEYTYLSPGTYTFKVKARIKDGTESAVASYRFIILPPWYRTAWAYAIYLLLAVGCAYSVYRGQKRKFLAQQQKHEEERKRLEYLNQLQAEKHDEEQKQLMYLHQLELERNEKEIIRLKNEKLESEIQLKHSELASTTLNLIQKGEMLVKVKEEFVRMKKVSEIDKESEDYKKIIRMLGDDKMKKNWEQFALHFDKVHSDFLVTLKSRYPNLTPSELKLCAYLRLNLASKEIAQVMNISIKSVELARYRLRKKLQIQPEVNLFNFLLNFHSEFQQSDK